jgi:hypothetical protein
LHNLSNDNNGEGKLIRRPEPWSVGVQAVDVGLTVAVTANQLRAQGVESIETGATVGRHSCFELPNRFCKCNEFNIVEGFDVTEPLARTDLVEFNGKRVVTQVFRRTRWPRRASGQVLGKHGAQIVSRISVRRFCPARRFRFDKVEACLRYAPRI